MRPTSKSVSVAARDRTLLRRASGILSTISVPFINSRPSLSVDTSHAMLDPNNRNSRFSTLSNWPQWNHPDDVNAPHVQIVIETAKEVHTCGEEYSDDREISSPTESVPMAQVRTQSSTSSHLKPRSYHYRKSRFIDQSFKQGYTLISRRLRSESRSMEQFFMETEAQQSTEAQDFEAAFGGAFTLSPVLNQPDSPESEMFQSDIEHYSTRRRSQSLHSYQSSSMQSGIESTSSIGYAGSKITPSEESLYNKEDQHLEQYASWIKFESPMDLLSPSISHQATSPSAASTYSLESPIDQVPSTSIPMIREEMQSYLGMTPIESSYLNIPNDSLPQLSTSQSFSALAHPGIDHGSHKFSFTLHTLPSHWNVSQAQEKIHHHIPTPHKSFRKKISQTFQGTFRKNKN